MPSSEDRGLAEISYLYELQISAMIHALATELADKGHFYLKYHFLWMVLAKGDLGMCFEGPHHLSTSPLTDYLFLSFCLTDNGP